jgi:hypothetical protein
MLHSALQSNTFLFLETFSNLVTTNSLRQSDWLARTGNFSIYALLLRIVPEVRKVYILRIVRVSDCSDRAFKRYMAKVSVKGETGLIFLDLPKELRLIMNAWQQLGIGEEIQQISRLYRISKCSSTDAVCCEVV